MSLTDDGVEPGKLFVGGLSWDTTKESLKAYFEQFGEVSDATVMKQPGTDVPRGFGFVTFANPENAALALSAKPHNLDGKTIDPKPATNKAEASRSGSDPQSNRDAHANKIFIGGTGDLTEDDIKAYFALKNQNVNNCELKYDKATGRTRGFGFVTFASEDETTKAVQEHIHQIKGKSVEAKYAQANRSAGRGNTQWPVQGGKPVAGFANPSVPGGYNYSAQMYSNPAQQQQQQYYGQQQYYTGGNSAAAYYGYGYGGQGGGSYGGAYGSGQQAMAGYPQESSTKGTTAAARSGYGSQHTAAAYGYDQQQQQYQMPSQYSDTQAASGYNRSQQQRSYYGQ